MADTVISPQRVVMKLSDGVYYIRHKEPPDHFSQCNTVVIIGANGVLVVDSSYLPSSAREDIAQIRQWTSQPVRYLVNTHWHGDHVIGNAAYAEAFPDLTIIAQTEAAKMMRLRIDNYLTAYPHRIEKFRRELDTGKDPTGRPLTKEEIDDLNVAVMGGQAASDAVTADFAGVRLKAPNATFDHELDIDLGDRTVELKYLGRGNTIGDVVAYLPKERIVVAGDLVDSPVPFFGSGFPVEQISTLKELSRLDFDTLVPGHGEVLKGKTFVAQETELLEEVVASMNREIGLSPTDPKQRLEELRALVARDVDVAKWRRIFAGDSPGNQELWDSFSWPALIEVTLAEMWPR